MVDEIGVPGEGNYINEAIPEMSEIIWLETGTAIIHNDDIFRFNSVTSLLLGHF